MTTDKKLSLLFISRKYITINANLELINTNILTFNWIDIRLLIRHVRLNFLQTK